MNSTPYVTSGKVKLTPGSQPYEECEPTTMIPAWWSAFMFRVLNPRQVCMYLYLAMLSDYKGECSPTIEQIREDLGLYSPSMVFEALAVLEDLGFIFRERQSFPGVRAKRNVYRRPPCPMTLLRLLERDRIDGELRPKGGGSPASQESQALVFEGLREVLGDWYERYAQATASAKREVLVECLQFLSQRQAG
jgi:DNA-binding transcriptional ArsR family regulator